MDLNHAIEAHTQWKMKFRTAIAQRAPVDARSVGRNDMCDLGRWLKASSAQFAGHAAFTELMALHTAFHALAGRLAGLIAAGKYDEAKAVLDSPDYAKASQQVAVAIVKLQASLKKAA
ncbi:MAG: CZB domain-containing protein [Myxococcaceae bacterium]